MCYDPPLSLHYGDLIMNFKPSVKEHKRKSNKKQEPFSTVAGKYTSLAGIISIELAIAGVIAATNHRVLDAYLFKLPEAWVWGSLSLVMGFLSTWAAMAAQQARNDPRPEQKDRATILQLASFACMILPALMLAEARTFPKQVADHEIYVETNMKSSDQKLVDLSATGQWVEPEALREAKANLERMGTMPKTPEIDMEHHGGEVVWAFIAYFLITQVGGFIAQPAPETEREAQRRVAKEIADIEARRKELIERRKAKTRERNKKIAKGSNIIPWPFKAKVA